MTKAKTTDGIERRDLLKLFGTSAGAAALAAPLVVAGEAQATESRADKVKARYRETDHVKAFYRTNRY